MNSVECDCDSTEQQDEDVKQEKERIANVEASPTDLSSFSVVVKVSQERIIMSGQWRSF